MQPQPVLWWRLLALAAPYRAWFGLAIALGFATMGSGIGLMATASYLIAQAALMPSIALLSIPMVGVRFFGIARAALRYGERYVAHRATFRLLAGVRTWFFAAVEPLAPAALVERHGGDLLARAVGDVETLEQLYLRVLAPPLVALLTALLTCALLISFDARSALAVLLLQLVVGLILPAVLYGASRRAARQGVAARAELLATTVEALQGLPDLLVLGGERALREQLAQSGRRLAAAQQQQANMRGISNGIHGMASQLAAVAVISLATPLVRTASLDGLLLAMLALAAMASFEALSMLAQVVQSGAASHAAAERIFAITASAPQVQHEPAQSPQPLDASLTIRDLSFSYPGSTQPVFTNLNMHVASGQRLILRGPSGAGKSTLVSLLLRFWEGYTGSICVGGHDLRAYRSDDARRLFAVVSQQTHLFNGTVAENLRLARPNACEADMAWACQRARFDQVLARLPEGYATRLGEQGMALSGGERQRLAIARALLKDAPILLLDEPTANLDAAAEREVLAALDALAQGRTTILITHRHEEQGVERTGL